MRVLIVFALVGIALGDVLVSPGYEYSSAVQTPTYNNYNYVRSGADLAAAVVSPYAYAPYFAPYAGLPTTRFVQAPAVVRAVPHVAAVPAAVATPAQIVSSYVEPTIVGQGILERKSQYHSQNILGETTFGHREPTQSHDSVQDAFGNRVGSYSYLSPDGRVLTTDYVADANGFRVRSNALPVAPVAPVVPAVAPAVIAARKRRSVDAEPKVETDEKDNTKKRSIAIVDAPLIGAPLVATSPYLAAPAIAPLSPFTRIASPYIHSAPLTYSSYAWQGGYRTLPYSLPYNLPYYY